MFDTKFPKASSPAADDSAIDHTVNKPWRDPALGYENYEVTADDGTRHIHAAEELVWSAFNGWPPEGHRVSFLDGNPANRALDNLILLDPEEAEQPDALAPSQSDEPFDEAAATALVTGWAFLEDENFEALFLDAGPALVFGARVICEPGQWELNFASDLHEPWEADQEPQHQGSVRTGGSSRTQTADALVIEAASVVGPFRDNDWHSDHEQALEGLRHLRGLILEEINAAVSTAGSVFKPDLVDWMANQLPCAEELLCRAMELYRSNDEPAVRRLLARLEASKSKSLN